MTIGVLNPLRRAVWTVAASLLLAAPVCAKTAEVVETHETSGGAAFEIRVDGTLSIRDVDGVLLDIAASLKPSHNLRRPEDWIFVSQRREGDDGGRRGFSPRADDDGDGVVDEERLDGRDDDGDGLIDEDFAAIGDDMTAVSVVRGLRALYLEAYHWDYPHLNDTVFTDWRRQSRAGDAQPERLVLELPYGVWQEMNVGWDAPNAAVTGDVSEALMMVATLPRDGGRWWIGVTLPGADFDGADPSTVSAPRVNGRKLELAFTGDLTAAITVTTTLTQLRYRQAVAHAVHAGAPAGPGEPAVSWLVPPLLHSKYVDESLAGTWDVEADGWRLDVELPADAHSLLDPETLRLLGQRLPAPSRVSWRGAADATPNRWTAPWPNPDYDELWRSDASPHPYRAHAAPLAPGWVSFHFIGAPLLGDEESLLGDSLCGQTLRLEVRAAPHASTVSNSPAGQTDGAPTGNEHPSSYRDIERRPPSLSPELLDNYPNPFQDHTRLRYTVPTTVGEGFVWEEDEQPTLKDSDPMPYSSGTPSVSLRVYSVAGHEVVTLFDGTSAIGTYETSWDGKDREGRPVAVGTYFCKLQIENWSVTKRVALLR